MYKIRYGLEEDIPLIMQGIKEICAIEKQAPDKNSEILESIQLALKNKEIRVISKNKVAIGFVQFKFTDKNPYGIDYGAYERKFCWIDWWYVAMDHRNKGVGKRLHQDLLALCKKKKIKEIILDVFQINPNAYEFYKNEGFVEFVHILREELA